MTDTHRSQQPSTRATLVRLSASLAFLSVAWFLFGKAQQDRLLILAPIATTATIVEQPDSSTITYRYVVPESGRTLEKTVDASSLSAKTDQLQPGDAVDIIYAADAPQVSQTVPDKETPDLLMRRATMSTFSGLFFTLVGLFFLLGVVPHEIMAWFRLSLSQWVKKVMLGLLIGAVIAFPLFIFSGLMPQLMWTIMGGNIAVTVAVVTSFGVLIGLLLPKQRLTLKFSLMTKPRRLARRKRARRRRA
jgi:hypothetical protein